MSNSKAPTLQTRKPTGRVPWPLVLVEGGEKSGKSWAAAVLSKSDKISRTLWLDWGEGAADEYGAIPGARYEVIEHDGSWESILGQVEAAREEAGRVREQGGKPVALVIDSMTAEWEGLKDWASARAATTSANRAKRERDPNAEVNVTMNLWNDAAARHRKLMTLLMTFPGIVVVTARGGEVALVENGRPVEGKKTYRVEGHKSLAFDVSCVIRLSRDGKPIVVGARSVHTGIRPGIDDPMPLKDDWTLEWVIFDALKCDPDTAHVRDLAEPQQDVLTPEQIRDEACDKRTTFARIRELYKIAVDLRYDGITLANGSGDEEELVAMLVRLGKERQANGRQSARNPQTRQPEAPAEAGAVPAGQEPLPAPGEPVTDNDWMIRLNDDRIPAAATKAALTKLRHEVGQKVAAGQCTKADETAILAYIDQREQELAGPAEQTGVAA